MRTDHLIFHSQPPPFLDVLAAHIVLAGHYRKPLHLAAGNALFQAKDIGMDQVVLWPSLRSPQQAWRLVS